MKRLFCIFLLPVMVVSSCGVYQKYESTVPSYAESVSEELPSWKEYFVDPLLQELIDSALAGNTSLSIAAIRLAQADENVKAARLSYVPSLFFEPNGGISLNQKQRTSYQLPLEIGWNFGSPGSLFSRKHQAQAKRIQTQDNYRAVLNELISQIATDYYMLQMLDEQVEVLENTISKWTETLDVQREYMLSGRVYYPSVAQMESKLLDAKQELLQARSDIKVWERTICLLLAKPYSEIARSKSGTYSGPKLIETGVDLGMLRSRPDIRAAERDLEIAFYITSEAKSAFYPSINITGLIGWPSVMNAALSLAQPLFAQGAIRSRLNVSKMDQEIVKLQFNQVLLQAATEVNQALSDYKLHTEKEILYSAQTEIQEKACEVIEEISRDGKANYLELVKSQEKLLSAQLGKVQSEYYTREAAVRLYKALGM